MDFLVTVIENGNVVEQSADPNTNTVFAIICLIIGVFNLLCPYGAWLLTQGWRFRDAEPSDFALTMARVSGVIAIIIGIVFFLL